MSKVCSGLFYGWGKFWELLRHCRQRAASNALLRVCAPVFLLGSAFLTQAALAQTVPMAGASLSSRGWQTVFLAPDGSVWGIGLNANGSLGDGTVEYRPAPVRMQTVNGPITGALDVACGNEHTAILMGNGTVWATGLNASGELGNGTTESQHKAVPVLTATGTLSGITAIAAGASHTLAIGANGEVWAWGSNAAGQPGNSSTIKSTRAN